MKKLSLGILSLFRTKFTNILIGILILCSFALMEYLVESIFYDNQLYQNSKNIRLICIILSACLYRRIERALFPSSIKGIEEMTKPNLDTKAKLVKIKQTQNNDSIKQKLKILADHVLPSIWEARFLYLLFIIVVLFF